MSTSSRFYRVQIEDDKGALVCFKWFAGYADAKQFCADYRGGATEICTVSVLRTVAGLLTFANEYASGRDVTPGVGLLMLVS